MRTITKGTLKWAAAGTELLELLVSAKGSFCKRVRFSGRFRGLWVLVQQSSPDELLAVCKNLSHSEVRFTSRSKPLQVLVLKLPAVLETLVAVSLDRKHKTEAAWAEGIISKVTGSEGFNRLVIFALDCDFGTAAYHITALWDKGSADISLSAAEGAQFLETTQALFQELGVFEENKATYTSRLLEGLKATKHVSYGRAREGRLGWPAQVDATTMAGAVRYARELAALARAFFDVHFPDYTWRARFSAFDFSPATGNHADATRLDQMEHLARKEGVDVAQARFQFSQALPYFKREYARTRDNRQCAAAVCELYRRVPGCQNGDYRFSPAMKAFITVAVTFLAILDTTVDNERVLLKIHMLTLRHRGQLLGDSSLSDLVKVVGPPRGPEIRLPGGRRCRQLSAAASCCLFFLLFDVNCWHS